jgi:nudix-type nucleoside diphosphatase (YffH/AdpP family)
MQTKILSNDWSVLKKLTYEFHNADGTWEIQEREAYDRGNGATVLLYNQKNQKIILTQQFRLPTYLNGNQDGMMIEACAGKVEQEDPETCMRREVEEETGYRINEIKKIFEIYMSPGSVTELIHFYVAPYDEAMKVNQGGGNSSEQENIEVIELSLNDAFAMVESGQIKDGKTIILLQYAMMKGLV